MVPSGSFKKGWVVDVWPDVKGKPAPGAGRRTTLDIGPPIDWRWGMNDPEVTMSDAPLNSNLIAYRKALDAAGLAIDLAKRVPAPLKSLADQVIRSAASVPANLAEGHGRLGRDRAHHWRIAYASAKEVDCHLNLLRISGAVHRGKVKTALQLFDDVRAMIWRLLHPSS